MRRRCGQSGFTLLEVLIALATILILIAAVMRVGSYVKTRANIDLTSGMLETLSTALAQYYDDIGDFPFVTEKDYTGDMVVDPYDESHLEYDLNGVVAPADAIDNLDMGAACSAALFYFLDKNPTSRPVASSVSNMLVTNKDASGADITFTFTATGTSIDLPRYIDPWKTSIRYVYESGAAFPVLTSAGPDGFFDTQDDITSK